MNNDHSNGMGKHMLIMLVCCLVPLALIAAVGVFGLSLGPLNGLVPLAAALMCPLMMIVMMRGMMGEHHSGETHSHHEGSQVKPTARTAVGVPGAVETSPSTQEQCH